LSNDTPTRLPVPGEDPVFRADGFESASPPVDPGHYTRVRFQHTWWKHILLFVLTLVTTTLVGAERHYAFLTDFGRARVPLDLLGFLLSGFWYSGTILAILGAHEMGHYLACRKYNVDATLPYFLPLFLPGVGLQIGTLGAVIRIREPFPTRRVLFDIGVAGPIAGFVVLVPALFWGLSMSAVTAIPDGTLIWLGKPLLYRIARWMMFGTLPDGMMLNLHPMVFAAWFGMLAIALNLLPFGQLDGGHITYATVGRFSTPISLATVASAVVMTFISRTWVLTTVVMLVMLALLGPRHPRVIDEYELIGRSRYLTAVFALVMLILCFTPIPIDL
jgi:membrane-associated protease RseP (regulator of RpoE activity)